VNGFLNGYQVRGNATMMAHIAVDMRNHGFQEHKSPAIYAFLVFKFHYVPLVTHSETLTPSSYCYKLPMKHAWFAVLNLDARHQGGIQAETERYAARNV
jgi:hypothetical protein